MRESKVLDAIKNRYSCKKYKDEEIPREDLETILEAGRLSPTSFGLEHFDIHVCRSEDIIDVCFNQESMKTAPLTIVLTVKRAKYYSPESQWFKDRGRRFPGTLEEFTDDYKGYWEYLKAQGTLDMWARSQSYIAISSMMNTASELGIESCAIEGYNNDLLIQRLGLNNEDDLVGIVCAFGYPDEKRDRVRREMKDTVVWHLEGKK